MKYFKLFEEYSTGSVKKDFKVGHSYQDGKVKKVEEIPDGRVKVTYNTGQVVFYQFDKVYKVWSEVDESVAEAAVNEAATDLQSYVKKASEKCFTGGGNGENLLGYGLPEAAGQIDAYLKGPRNEDWIYTDKTATAFMKFIDTMVEEEIKNNQVDESVSEGVEKLDIAGLPPVVQDVLKDKAFKQISSTTKIKEGDEVIGIWNGWFGEITKITGDKYKIVYDADGDISNKNRTNLERNFLVRAKK